MSIMFRFVYYSYIDYLYEQIAHEKNVDFYEVLISPEKYIRKSEIETIHDIHQIVSQDSVFGDQAPDVIEMKGFAVDSQTLTVLQNVQVDFLITIIDPSSEPCSSETKKKLQKANIEYIELKKPDPSTKLALAQKLNQKKILQLEMIKIQALSSQASSYNEIINWFDLLELSPNKSLTMKEILLPQSPELYTQNFDLNKISNTVPTWLDLVNDDNLQLAISLVYTKLDKQSHPKSKEALKLLIEADYNMKSMSKLDQLTQWKLFLYRIKKLL